MIHFIYRWKDPRITDIVLCTKYVGVTNNPNSRIGGHMLCDGTNPEKDAWIKDLLRLGLNPVMEIVEIVYDRRKVALAREQYWINYYIDLGCDLFNIKIEGKTIKKNCILPPRQNDPVKQSTPKRISPFLQWC